MRSRIAWLVSVKDLWWGRELLAGGAGGSIEPTEHLKELTRAAELSGEYADYLAALDVSLPDYAKRLSLEGLLIGDVSEAHNAVTHGLLGDAERSGCSHRLTLTWYTPFGFGVPLCQDCGTAVSSATCGRLVPRFLGRGCIYDVRADGACDHCLRCRGPFERK